MKTEDKKKVGDIKFYAFKEKIWAIKMRWKYDNYSILRLCKEDIRLTGIM